MKDPTGEEPARRHLVNNGSVKSIAFILPENDKSDDDYFSNSPSNSEQK